MIFHNLTSPMSITNCFSIWFLFSIFYRGWYAGFLSIWLRVWRPQHRRIGLTVVFADIASRRKQECEDYLAAQGVCVCVFMFLFVCVCAYCVLICLDILIWCPKACRLQLRICIDRWCYKLAICCCNQSLGWSAVTVYSCASSLVGS